MAEVWFYHLQRAPLDAALPNLVERTLGRGWRAVIRTSSEERLKHLNALLWTFSQNSFIPHGSKADGNADRQPVYLTTEDENPNSANVLFLVDGVEESDPSRFERCIMLFEGENEQRVSQARTYWTALKDKGVDVKYWKQQPNGRWEEAG